MTSVFRRLAVVIGFAAALALLLAMPSGHGAKQHTDHRTAAPLVRAQLRSVQFREAKVHGAGDVPSTTPVATQAAVEPVEDSAPTSTNSPAQGVSTQTPPSGSLLDNEPSYLQSIFACIEWHESRGQPTVVNATSGDGGLFQFNVTTWLAHGGGQFASAAQYATATEQEDVAVWTYQATGFEPWLADIACWT